MVQNPLPFELCKIFMDDMIKVQNISKVYPARKGGVEVHALNNVSNTIQRGEVVVVIGPSGSGKSTFLRTLNGLESFDTGSVVIDGIDISSKKTDMNNLRAEVGMVFQHFNLFQHKTALENIVLPQMVVAKRSKEEAEAMSKRWEQ